MLHQTPQNLESAESSATDCHSRRPTEAAGEEEGADRAEEEEEEEEEEEGADRAARCCKRGYMVCSSGYATTDT
jgi:hypothetical protein